MRATVMHGAGDVRIEDVPDPSIVDPTDAILRVTRGLYLRQRPVALRVDGAERDRPVAWATRRSAIVEDVGAEVRTLKRGDLVVMPFAISDGTCEFCHEGLQTACVHVAFFGNNGMNGAQAEALRIPYADGTLYPLPVARGRRADAVAAHAVRRDGHRPPRRRRRQGRGRARASRWSATAPSACAA